MDKICACSCDNKFINYLMKAEHMVQDPTSSPLMDKREWQRCGHIGPESVIALGSKNMRVYF
ncbi:hypothetical protein D918_04110 [Trichuris suis]|nr:hypothetical protein D918_04110 [Trichuris suis]